MTIEKSLENISTALHAIVDALDHRSDVLNSVPAQTPQDDKVPPPLASVPDPAPTPEPYEPSEGDLIAALEQFIPARKEEAMIIMNKFGVAKKSDVPPGMRAGLIQELNAVYHS